MGLRDWFGRLQRPPPEPVVAAPRRLPTLSQLGMSAALLADERGDDACVGCGFCEAICPTQAIVVEGSGVSLSARHGRLRAWPLRFELDPGRCVACELCMQVCPTDAIRLFRGSAPPSQGTLGLDELRAQAAFVQKARRRSPLGPVPGDEPKAPLVRPSTGAPGTLGPAADLHRPYLGTHPTETATSEPTRLESWAHPIDAATDPDSDDIEAIDDPRSWLSGWREDESAPPPAVLPDPAEWEPRLKPPLRPPDPQGPEVETMPVRPEAADRSGETTDELKVVPPRRRG